MIHGPKDISEVEPDLEERAVIIVRPDAPVESASATLRWHPADASEPLIIQLAELFD